MVCYVVCMHVLDGKGSWVFARRAIVVLQTAVQYLTGLKNV